MDYRFYRNNARKLIMINITLGGLYLLSFIALAGFLIYDHPHFYYLQTNTGFIFPIKSFLAKEAKKQPLTVTFGLDSKN